MRTPLRASLATVGLALGLFVNDAAAAGSLIISEFRVTGHQAAPPTNSSRSTTTAARTTPSRRVRAAGTASPRPMASMRCTIPNGTVIPARGHYLCVNSDGYSLGTYPAGSTPPATPPTRRITDGTIRRDIRRATPGIALFNNNTGGGSFILANRFDAVGSIAEANTLYKEGTGYPKLTPFSIDYAWVRDECGKGGAVNLSGACTISTPEGHRQQRGRLLLRRHQRHVGRRRTAAGRARPRESRVADSAQRHDSRRRCSTRAWLQRRPQPGP